MKKRVISLVTASLLFSSTTAEAAMVVHDPANYSANMSNYVQNAIRYAKELVNFTVKASLDNINVSASAVTTKIGDDINKWLGDNAFSRHVSNTAMGCLENLYKQLGLKIPWPRFDICGVDQVAFIKQQISNYLFSSLQEIFKENKIPIEINGNSAMLSLAKLDVQNIVENTNLRILYEKQNTIKIFENLKKNPTFDKLITSTKEINLGNSLTPYVKGYKSSSLDGISLNNFQQNIAQENFEYNVRSMEMFSMNQEIIKKIRTRQINLKGKISILEGDKFKEDTVFDTGKNEESLSDYIMVLPNISNSGEIPGGGDKGSTKGITVAYDIISGAKYFKEKGKWEGVYKSLANVSSSDFNDLKLLNYPVQAAAIFKAGIARNASRGKNTGSELIAIETLNTLKDLSALTLLSISQQYENGRNAMLTNEIYNTQIISLLMGIKSDLDKQLIYLNKLITK